MKIIHRYILAETVGPYGIGLFTFTLVVLLQRFSRLADLVVAKGVPASLAGTLLLSLFPSFLEITLPAALLLAILLAVGRLAADSETTALAAAGVGMRGVAPPVLAVSAVTFLASLAIVWSGIPWGTRAFNETMARILSARTGAAASEHVFTEIAPDVLLYPDRVSADGTRMSGVLISQRIRGQEPALVFAREGRFLPESGDAGVGLLLSDGAIHHEEGKDRIYRLATFGQLTFRLPRGAVGESRRDAPRALTLPQLASKIRETGGRGREGAGYLFHFHRRLSLAASCLVYGLLAVPLGLSQRSRGRSTAMALTVSVILLYYLFIAAARAVSETAPAAAVAILWLPDAVGLAVAARAFWISENRPITLRSLLLSPGGRE